MRDELYLAKFLIGLAFLIVASKMDLDKREVPNKVWKYMFLAIFPLTLIELIVYNELLIAVVQTVLVVGLSLLFYYLGLYGGADAKALIVLAVLFPHYPEFLFFPLYRGLSFAFSTLFNSVIFAPFLPIVFLFRNVIKEGFDRKNLLNYFIGKRVNVNEIPKHHALLEFIDEKGNLARVRRGVEPDEAIIKRLKEAGIKKVWVTPQIPFIVFITFGYVVAFFIGSPIEFLIQRYFLSQNL